MPEVQAVSDRPVALEGRERRGARGGGDGGVVADQIPERLPGVDGNQLGPRDDELALGPVEHLRRLALGEGGADGRVRGHEGVVRAARSEMERERDAGGLRRQWAEAQQVEEGEEVLPRDLVEPLDEQLQHPRRDAHQAGPRVGDRDDRDPGEPGRRADQLRRGVVDERAAGGEHGGGGGVPHVLGEHPAHEHGGGRQHPLPVRVALRQPFGLGDQVGEGPRVDGRCRRH